MCAACAVMCGRVCATDYYGGGLGGGGVGGGR